MERVFENRELTDIGVNMRNNAAGKRRIAKVNLAESPLTWLYARGHLDERLFAAGEQLRSDYERAQLGARITMRWDAVRIKGASSDYGLSGTEKQIAAKARFDGAIAAAGNGLADILWRVVCAGEGLPDAEKVLKWPARSGKLVLKLALERVADYYRIP